MVPVVLTPHRQALLRACAVATVALLAVSAVLLLLVPGRLATEAGSLAGVLGAAFAAGLCAARVAWGPEGGEAWRGATAGLTLWVLGFAASGLGVDLWAGRPSASDVVWTCAYVALAWTMVRVASNRAPRRLATSLDLAGAALTLATLSAAVVLPLASEWIAENRVAETAPVVAYPIGDAALVSLLIVLTAQAGWRPGRAFATLCAAGGLLTLSDLGYLVDTIDGTYAPGDASDVGWYVAAGLIAAAAWMPQPRTLPRLARPSDAGLGLPIAAAATAVAVLAAGAVADLSTTAIVLALATVTCAALRLCVTHAELRGLSDTRRLTLTDDLTELPNRRRLVQALQEALAAPGGAGLVLVDIDRFKELNAALGHAAGDVLLARVAAHLRAELKPGEVAARLGGDEFAVLTPGTDVDAAAGLAQRVLRRLGEPVVLDGVAVRAGASAGVATAEGGDAELLLRRAGIALRRAKGFGGVVARFDPDLDADAGDRVRLRAELSRGLERGEIELYLQPIAELGDGRISGVEGLVRWHHPTRGLLTPDAFLDVLEGALAARFSRYVLDRAVRESVALRKAGRPVRVGVNLTPADLLDVQLPQDLEALLRARRARAEDLVVEVTESGVLVDVERTAGNLTAIRALGVSVALDDFGTGYSSLTHLQRLPVDAIKLDRSFVAGVACEAREDAIVRALVRLAHTLGLRVVAEGVEDEATWHVLRELGCHHVQGWVLAPALPPAELHARFDALQLAARRIARGDAAQEPALSAT